MKLDLWHGDCLELMKNIPDKSIDMVLKKMTSILKLHKKEF